MAILLGVIAATMILFAVGFVANAIKPTPPELMDPQTPEAVERRVDAASTFTWLSTIFGLGLGAFCGGVIGAKVARDSIVWVTGAIGLLLSPWAFYTFYIVYPKVLWVPAAMLISVLLFSYFGGFVVVRSYQTKRI